MDRYLARWALLIVEVEAWGPDHGNLGKKLYSQIAALTRPRRHMLHTALA